MKVSELKQKVVTTLLNLIKVKSILTFTAAALLVYTTVTNKLQSETTAVIITLVFESLFKKGKEK